MNPNVLIITIDALRADRVGILDGKEITPNIDKLATESAIFTNAFSTSNATDVAVTSIQTGKYPLSHGVINHGRRVTSEEKASIENTLQLPEILSKEGYTTAKFGRPLGRWHRNGFDRYPSKMESRTAFDKKNNKLDKMENTVGSGLSKIHPSIRNLAATTYNKLSETIKKERSYQQNKKNDSTLEEFDNFIRERDDFYAFIHLMDTHAPYNADPDLVESYLRKFNYDVEKVEGMSEKVPQKFHSRVINGAYPEIKKNIISKGTSPVQR